MTYITHDQHVEEHNLHVVWGIYYTMHPEEGVLLTKFVIERLYVIINGHEFPVQLSLVRDDGEEIVKKLAKPLLDLDGVREECESHWLDNYGRAA